MWGAGLVLAAPRKDIYSGLWGYNSTLSCIAITEVFYVITWSTLLLAVICGKNQLILLQLQNDLHLLCFLMIYFQPFFLCVHDCRHLQPDVWGK